MKQTNLKILNKRFLFSTIRQVPDHEEAFVHPITDQSIMIEILEYFDGENKDAAE